MIAIMERIDLTLAVHEPGWQHITKDIRHYVRDVVVETLQYAMEDFHIYKNNPKATIGMAVVLTDAKEIRELNCRFRGKDSATNVLSFPADMEAPQPENQELVLGDIIIAYEVIAQEALEQHKTTLAHFTHMIVHGLLHLLGFDHILSSDAEEMEQAERDILFALGFPDPYLYRHDAPVVERVLPTVTPHRNTLESHG